MEWSWLIPVPDCKLYTPHVTLLPISPFHLPRQNSLDSSGSALHTWRLHSPYLRVQTLLKLHTRYVTLTPYPQHTLRPRHSTRHTSCGWPVRSLQHISWATLFINLDAPTALSFSNLGSWTRFEKWVQGYDKKIGRGRTGRVKHIWSKVWKVGQDEHNKHSPNCLKHDALYTL